MKAFKIFLLAAYFGASGLVMAESQADKNMKDAEKFYKEQQAEKQKQQYQQYLKNKDHADGKGVSAGYKWSTK